MAVHKYLSKEFPAWWKQNGGLISQQPYSLDITHLTSLGLCNRYCEKEGSDWYQRLIPAMNFKSWSAVLKQTWQESEYQHSLPHAILGSPPA
jgi:hypothetical protein